MFLVDNNYPPSSRAGYGTLSILQLIANYPDQAVVLLNHFGMTPAHEKVYGPNWNPHNLLVDGIYVHRSTEPEVRRM
jgi:hypothetical protein